MADKTIWTEGNTCNTIARCINSKILVRPFFALVYTIINVCLLATAFLERPLICPKLCGTNQMQYLNKCFIEAQISADYV